MEEEILKKFVELEEKLNKIHRSVEQARKYFLWSLIISVAVIVIPLIALIFLLPQLLTVYKGYFNF